MSQKTRCSAGGSAPVSGTGGREFESRHFDHEKSRVKALLFSWSKWLVMRNRFKPQVTFPFSISTRGLLPSLLGGVQSPATSTNTKGSHMGPLLYWSNGLGERSLQIASYFLISDLLVRFDPERSEDEFRDPPLRPNLTHSNVRNSKRIVNGLVRFFLCFSNIRKIYYQAYPGRSLRQARN